MAITLARSAPGPRSRLPGGLLFAFRRDPLGLLQRLAREYGDIVRMRVGVRDLYLLNHPDYVKDVLVTHQRSFGKGEALRRARVLLGDGLLTSEGEVHLRQRRLAQPAFHRQRVHGYGAVMSAYGERMAARWQAGEMRDIHQEMMRLTMAIVARTLFDADVEDEADEIGVAIHDVLEMFNLVMVPFLDLLMRLPLPVARRFERARRQLDATVHRMIAARRASGEDRGDLLSMLLLATDTEGDGGGMSDQQLRDEAMTIFLAGHETTANALTWTWYLLAQHPEVEARMHAEVDALGGQVLTADDLPRLPYTRQVLAESMRLYPPAWVLGRRTLEPYTVGGYTLAPGAVILMSQYLLHRDPRFWDAPERFDPDRWTREMPDRPKFSYFPFGGGARQCIGEHFAWMEGVLLLATIARRWRLRLAPDQRTALQPLVTLRPRYGMRMHIEGRG